MQPRHTRVASDGQVAGPRPSAALRERPLSVRVLCHVGSSGQARRCPSASFDGHFAGDYQLRPPRKRCTGDSTASDRRQSRVAWGRFAGDTKLASDDDQLRPPHKRLTDGYRAHPA
ncbi:hypothetical protein GCM10027203_26340 [Nonomuraea fastidiosa]